MNVLNGRRIAVIALAALTVVFGLGLSRAQAQVADTPVDLELSLLLDVSGSVDATEFDLQRQGYVDAFNSATLATAISKGKIGAIAVNLIYWSVGQVEAVSWTLIDGTAGNTAADFATLVAGTARPSDADLPTGIGAQTALGDAIDFSVSGFGGNGFTGTDRKLDISGDGGDNASGKYGIDSPEPRDPEDTAALAASRTAALAAGFTINGLTIGHELSGSEPTGLEAYYASSVIGGPGSFVKSVDTYDDFNAAIEEKLVLEIVPEPATMGLLAVGGVLALVRRRRRTV